MEAIVCIFKRFIYISGYIYIFFSKIMLPMLKLDANYGFYEFFLNHGFIFRFYVAFTLDMSNNQYPQILDSPPHSLFYLS